MRVGVLPGVCVAACVGVGVIVRVGVLVRDDVRVGVRVGFLVGDGVGVRVGDGVGLGVGDGDAVGVGLAVGVGVGEDSNAPMSQAAVPLSSESGRVTPRWSVVTGWAGDCWSVQSATGILSIAGLPDSSASVCVGPPLSCKGPSRGLVLFELVAAVKPQVASSEMLKPLSVMTPLQFKDLPKLKLKLLDRIMLFNKAAAQEQTSMPSPPLLVLPETVLLVITSVPASTSIPADDLFAAFPDTVLLRIVILSRLNMPPPSSAELPETVLAMIVSVGWPVLNLKSRMPPPSRSVELPEMVLFVIVSVPPFKMPPPPAPELVAELPDTVLFVMLSVPALAMPPPPVGHPLHELPVTVLLMMLSVPAFATPAPFEAEAPFSIIKRLRVTVAPLPTIITWTALFPLIATPDKHPSPSISTGEVVVMVGKVLCKVIVGLEPQKIANPMVVPAELGAAQTPPLTSIPALTLLIAARKVQNWVDGVSLVVVTKMVPCPSAGEPLSKM